MKMQKVQLRNIFIIVILLAFLGCTAQDTERTELHSAQVPEEIRDGSEVPSEARRREQAIFLRDVLASHQADLERIANDLIGHVAQSQQPFSMEYDVASEELNVTSVNANEESKEAVRSGILSAVNRIHSNPQLEDSFEQIWMIAELRGFSSYVVQFVLPADTDESECHHRLSLCYSLEEAPLFMSYNWVEAIDSHWFLMEEIME